MTSEASLLMQYTHTAIDHENRMIPRFGGHGGPGIPPRYGTVFGRPPKRDTAEE